MKHEPRRGEPSYWDGYQFLLTISVLEFQGTWYKEVIIRLLLRGVNNASSPDAVRK